MALTRIVCKYSSRRVVSLPCPPYLSEAPCLADCKLLLAILSLLCTWWSTLPAIRHWPPRFDTLTMLFRSITKIHHYSIGYNDTSTNSLFSTRCCCQRHSQSGLDEGYKQATMTTQPSSSNEQSATCFDWVITFVARTQWFTHVHLVDC